VSPKGVIEGRLPQAAAYLMRAANHVEHVAAEERQPMPFEVRQAIATIRQWCRRVGAADR
jgi:hypothetical protein